MRTIHILGILVLLALALPAAPAHAGGVVTVCDEAHLRVALAGGGTVTFACSGRIILTAEIVIAADTTIDGTGQAVIISGNNAVRVFTVNAGVTFDLNELTVANGNTGEGRGGGIYNSGTLNLNHGTFSGNRARNGGGIWNGGGTLSLNNSTFSGNDAVVGGGIYSTGTSSTVIVSNSTFSDNTASLNGGGIANGSMATVSNSTFTGNHASRGGGIDSYYRLTVSNSAFDHNQATNMGGGIDNTGTATVSNSTFLANRSTYFGGGINNWSGGRVSLSDSTFSSNSADQGGGIHNERGAVGVSNSTFSDNSASGTYYGDGGGIMNYGTLTVSNSTFAGNSAYGVDGVGGGICNNNGTATLKNTIVADSPSGGNCAGPITDGGGNLSYPDTTCPGINADPLLGPLQNNGGPTWTMALGPGSAAIDAGIDATCAADPVNGLDQRGVTRPQGSHCDIGAYERQLFGLWFPYALVQ